MIVIPRKKDESVIIDDDIILTVIDVRGDQVRLGIEIPWGGTVHRREVYEAILDSKDGRDTETPSLLEPGSDR